MSTPYSLQIRLSTILIVFFFYKKTALCFHIYLYIPDAQEQTQRRELWSSTVGTLPLPAHIDRTRLSAVVHIWVNTDFDALSPSELLSATEQKPVFTSRTLSPGNSANEECQRKEHSLEEDSHVEANLLDSTVKDKYHPFLSCFLHLPTLQSPGQRPQGRRF